MKSILLAIMGCLILSMGAHAKSGWLTSYGEAVKKAKAENKRVLMDFTGVGWCPNCEVLQKRVFDTPEFQKYAADNLVLLELDFSRELEPKVAGNEKLYEKYGIEFFPTLIVLNKDEKQVGIMGYVPSKGNFPIPLKPADFIESLKNMK
jgi:protein disulfide-isomerase